LGDGTTGRQFFRLAQTNVYATLAADLGVNLNTIATAYRELQKDGLIVVKHGSGSVVAARAPTARTPGELRTPLRTALFVLAGWTKDRILEAVTQELEIVGRGGK
jgi:GntR family transcriptional regulator